jgi:hypothetical protein
MKLSTVVVTYSLLTAASLWLLMFAWTYQIPS